MAKSIKNFESLIPPNVRTETVNGSQHIPQGGWNDQGRSSERDTPYWEPRDCRLPEKI